jgi:curved DNA-binding protein
VSPDELEDLFGGASPFSDFFYDMFGQQGGAPSGRGRATRAARPPRQGSHVEGEVDITLEEAVAGTTRVLEIGPSRVEVKIPAGIKDGGKVRVAGHGGPGSGGGRAGDVYITVRVRPHPVFTREGDNIRVTVPVPLQTALLGGEVEVPTPKGRRVKLKVPGDSQNGRVLRLRGLGMPHLKGGGAGDLLAELDVRLPVPLTPELKAWAESMPEQV